MKKIYTFLMIALCSVITAQAQNITGNVVLPNGEVSLSSTLTLYSATDSQAVKYSAVDEEGAYVFEKISEGQYYIVAEEMGYGEGHTEVFIMNTEDIHLPNIFINAITTEYNTVNVFSKKPIIELKPDMTVFNVDSTINSVGLDAFELLRRSPGVVVDKDDNLTLNGKSGLIVMIDGRITPMNGKELGEYLRSIPSNTIDKIELISNPSAKYDAAGNAGIINIKLKKNNNVGMHGSVNLGYSVGVYSKYDAGFNINRRSDKTNIFASYSARTGNSWNNNNFERELADSIYTSRNTSRHNNTSHNFKTGIDYYVNKHSTLGVIVQGVLRETETHSGGRMETSNLDGVLQRYSLLNSIQDGRRNNFNTNLNYAYNSPDEKSSLTWDIDYGIYDFDMKQKFPYQYFTHSGENTHNHTQQYDVPVNINVLTSKLDYMRKLGAGTLSTGAKVSHITTENVQKTFWDRGTGLIFSPSESNQYDYTESIQALYGQYQQQVKNFNYYLGLRLENTITNGHSVGEVDHGSGLEPFDSVQKRNYLGLFPNAGITYNKNPMSQWSLNYSRRIDRPNYQDLNPFVFRVDEFIDRVGNGYLRPQISNKLSLGHTFMYMINTRLEYTHTKDMFGELIDTSCNRLAQSKQNINSMDMISLNISIPYRWKELSIFTNLNTNYAKYQSDFGENRELELDAFSFNAYGQVSYNIKPWLTAEVSGWYASPSIYMGTFRSIAMGGIDAGLQSRIFNNKGVLKLSVGDVFKTMKWGGTSDFVGQKLNAYGYWESQRVSLNFSYNFGNNKYKGKSRQTGIEDEKTRIESDGGQGGGMGGR